MEPNSFQTESEFFFSKTELKPNQNKKNLFRTSLAVSVFSYTAHPYLCLYLVTFAMRSVHFISCVVLSVCMRSCCRSDGPILLKLGTMIGPISRKNWLTFGGDTVADMDFRSLFHFPHHCRIREFGRFINI